MALVCHVISLDHVMQGLSNMGGSFLRLVTILPSFVAIGIVLNVFNLSRDLPRPRDYMVMLLYV